MNFHEYQAKELFEQYNIPVPKGQVARTADEAVEAAKSLNCDMWVVKAQVHAGGRGKARRTRTNSARSTQSKTV